MARSTLTLRQTAAIVCGLIMMVTPLALWVAWTPTVLGAVLATGALAAVLCVVLAEDPAPDTVDRRHVPLHASRKIPSDAFFAELMNIGPWIHHNRLTATGAFRRKMDRLRRLLDTDQDG